MDADERRSDLNGRTEKILGCAYEVSNVLGCGFLEKVYENALSHEMRRSGLDAAQQVPIPVYYDDVVVGDYVADMVVEGAVLVELKAVNALDEVHTAQCLNYLKATGLKVCLLLNFAKPRLQIKRIVNGF
jgi:GxxExxY protein